jgi:DNA-directed RNA polymerase specialized sigma24 family protein
MPEATARSHVHRARRTLAAELTARGIATDPGKSA